MSYFLILELCTLISPNHWSPHCRPVISPYASKVACETQADFYNSAFQVAKAWDNSARLNEPMLLSPARCEEVADGS